MNSILRGALICIALASADFTQAQQSDKPHEKSSLPLQGQSQIFFRAEKLLGRSAQSPLGQDLGKLQDVAFNPEKGIYGIVKGENDRLYALPWSLVTAVTEKAVVFNTSKQELSGAPTFTDRQWAKLNDPRFTGQLDKHFLKGAMGSSSGPERHETFKGSGVSPVGRADTNLNAGSASSAAATNSAQGGDQRPN